jgi:putative FmdB family regulatory protein
MPIYAYKCSSCGHELDVLRKVSDAPLSNCPNCQEATFAKQLTAAGFQLKGSGWYATDFKNGSGARKGARDDKGEPKATDSSTAAKTDGAAKTGGATKTDGSTKSDSGAKSNSGAKSDGGAKTEKGSSTASAGGSC